MTLKRPDECAVWVLVTPAYDLNDVWIAHALDYDVISQGGSPREAAHAVRGALELIVEHGSVLADYQVAEAEEWALAADVFRGGAACEIPERSERSVSYAGVVLLRQRSERHLVTRFDWPWYRLVGEHAQHEVLRRALSFMSEAVAKAKEGARR